MRIRAAEPADAPAVTAIYNEGIAGREATFETRPREPDEVAAWLEEDGLLLVADDGGGVVGWARVTPYSDRCVYEGVGEHGVYVARAAGFREVGVERRHGRLDGEWRDCVPVERLLGEAAG